MKKKVILCVLLVLSVTVTVFAYQNRNNIAGLIAAIKYSDEEIQTKLDNSNDDLKSEINKYLDEDLREFTQEEQEAIDSGETTREEVLSEIIKEKNNRQQQNNNQSSSTDNGKSSVPGISQADAIVRTYTAELLSLEGKYVGYIEGILSSAIDKFYALPPDQRTYSAKMKVMQDYVGQINSLEAQCDGEVETIIARLTSELKSINADTSIIKSIRKAYNNEKSLKKAYYINQYS